MSFFLPPVGSVAGVGAYSAIDPVAPFLLIQQSTRQSHHCSQPRFAGSNDKNKLGTGKITSNAYLFAIPAKGNHPVPRLNVRRDDNLINNLKLAASVVDVARAMAVLALPTTWRKRPRVGRVLWVGYL